MLRTIEKLLPVTCGLLATALCAGAVQAQTATAAAATITIADVEQRVGIIAHDSMRGRATPSPGLELTAAYIADQFRAFGLKPAGDSGTFIQRYPLVSRDVDASARMIELAGNPGFSPKFATDFFVVRSAVETVADTAFFVGTAAPGMMIPEAARGRIVVVAVPDTIGMAWQARLNALFPAVMQVQAKGVIVLLDPAVTEKSVGQVAGPISGQEAPFPIFFLRTDAAGPLLAGTGLDPAVIFSEAGAPAQPMPGVTLRLSTPFTMSTSNVPNVVGILPGSDPVLRDEYVVYSAHMDHVGVGPADASGDSIFNGADDDASGTSGVIEIAQAFASLPQAPRRSVMFLLVSGEEKGLLGSKHYANNSTVPIGQIVANINMDMIGRNHPDSVTAIGLDYTSLGETAVAVTKDNPSLGLVIAPDMQPEEQLFLRSDHFSFAAKNVPAIFFTTGLHDDYHSQSDEPATLDEEKLVRVARMAFLVGERVANTTEKPVWTQTGLDVVRAATAGGQ